MQKARGKIIAHDFSSILMAGPPLVLLMVAGWILPYQKKDMALKSFLGGYGGSKRARKKPGLKSRPCQEKSLAGLARLGEARPAKPPCSQSKSSPPSKPCKSCQEKSKAQLDGLNSKTG